MSGRSPHRSWRSKCIRARCSKSGSMDLAAVDGALDWLTVVDTTASHAHTAAELKPLFSSVAIP